MVIEVCQPKSICSESTFDHLYSSILYFIEIKLLPGTYGLRHPLMTYAQGGGRAGRAMLGEGNAWGGRRAGRGALDGHQTDIILRRTDIKRMTVQCCEDMME
jgi:hypothetical protein